MVRAEGSVSQDSSGVPVNFLLNFHQGKMEGNPSLLTPGSDMKLGEVLQYIRG